MTDDALLDSLAGALSPSAAPSEPSVASLQALRRAIDTSATGLRPPRYRPARTMLPVLAATMGVVAVAIAAVVVTRSPRIDRQTASESAVVALTSPAFGEVVEHRVALAAALADGDAAAVAKEASALRVAVTELPAGEWMMMRYEVGALLVRAEAFVEAAGASTVESSTSSTTTSTTTTTSTASTTNAPAAPITTAATTQPPATTSLAEPAPTTAPSTPTAPPVPTATEPATTELTVPPPSLTVPDEDSGEDDDEEGDEDD